MACPSPSPPPSLVSFCAILFFLSSSFALPFAFGADSPSAYEILKDYNFPPGLLPKGVTKYKLNRDTGEFSAHLNETCKFPVESYRLEYQPTIEGVITKGRLSNLAGVKVNIMVMWVNIVEVVRKEKNLEFSVGIASADFPVDNFVECPQCGCGFDCDEKKHHIVSSS